MNNPHQFSLKAAIGVLTLASLLLALAVYALRPAAFYNADEITVHAQGIHDHFLELRFSTPAETLYSCPGVRTEKHDGVIDVYFHRVPINRDSFTPEILADPSSDFTRSIKIPYNIKSDGPVEIRLDGTKGLGKWSMGDAPESAG